MCTLIKKERIRDRMVEDVEHREVEQLARGGKTLNFSVN
jgi:hypothetical protein